MHPPTQIGVIADTHGLLRPEALRALTGSDLIIHAGDVGRPELLQRLSQIAPVLAIRGYVDKGLWAAKLPTALLLKAAAGLIYVLHDLQQLDLDPVAAGIRMVISGHSHQPGCRQR